MHLLVHPRNARLSLPLWAALALVGVAAALLAGPSAWADGCVIINGTRACPVGPEPGGGSYNPPSSGDRWQDDTEERERAQRDARYQAVRDQVNAAYERRDYREALRLLRHQQTLRDGPNVQADIASLERHFAEQANIERGDRYHQQANSAKDKGDSQLALKLYQQALEIYPNPSAEYRQFVADYQKYVQHQTQAHENRLKREAEAAELERRYRPEVERLRSEAGSMIDTHPAEALARLDAALKLLPGDTKTSGDRWLAQASLTLGAADFDAALEAVKKAEGFSPDPAEVAKWKQRIRDERDRQGAGVQGAFEDLRQSLAAPSAKVDPAAQLKSIERSSRQALDSPVAEKSFLTPGMADRKVAGEGFDTSGDYAGTLVHPDSKQHRHGPPSELDKEIPKGAQGDPQIVKMQDWYRSLNARKTDKEQQIAALREQQKTDKDPLLAAKITTLGNDVERLADDQGRATKAVKERVAVIKKRMVDKGLDWDESPAVAPAATRAGVEKPGSAPAPLNFIQD